MARGGRYGAPAGYGPGSGGSDDDSGGGGDDDEPDGGGGGVDLDIGFGGGGGGGGDDDSSSGGGSPGGSSPPPTDVGGPGDGDSGGRDPSDPSDAPSATPDPRGSDSGGSAPSDPRNAPSATPAPGGDDGGRDAGDPTDAPSATPDPGGSEQGLEAGGAADRIVDAAAGLEQDVVDRFPSLDGSDVRVERSGDQLEAELTDAGRAAFVEERTDGRDPDNPADAPGASGPMPSGDAGASITIPGVDDPAAGTGSSGSGPQGSGGQTGLEGGDQRLFNEEREQRREAAAQEEQFGDIEVDSPVSDNRLEEDLETGAEEFRDLAASVGATTASVGAPSIGTGQLPEPGQARDADLEGLDSQVFESASETFNPFGIAAGAKEVAEFGLTQPQRIAEGPEERGEFRDDVEQRAGRIAASTTERASQNPAEFVAGTALGLGFGAIGGGAAGSATRRLSGGRIDLGSDLSGRALERAGSGARRFLDDDRAQADLSGFGRGDGGGSGSATGGDGPADFEDFLDEDVEQIADIDDARSQELDQIAFEANRRADETRNQADLEDVARDPGTQTVDNRAGGRGVTTRDARTASRDRAPLGQGGTTGRTFGSDATDPELSPLESQLAAQLDTPDVDLRRRADADSDSGTVSNALARRRESQEPFALGSGLGAAGSGVGGLFGVESNPATGARSQVDTDIFGRTGADSFADTFVASDARADLDSRLDADARLDLDTRTDTDTRIDTDTRTDFDTRFDTRTDTRIDTRIDTRTDTDTRFDTRQDFEFGDDEQRDDAPPLFGTVSQSDTVDSGLQSGAEAAADLFGGGDRDDDPFSL